MSTQSDLPVAVIGAGPVGLAAAAHLVERGLPVRIYESGATAAANVRSWSHVRLFSPWRHNTDPAAVSLLRTHGWQEPPGDVLPTGGDLDEAYLQPLAQTPQIRAALETNTKVRAISRDGIDKVVSKNREARAFALTIAEPDGRARIDLARAVIDASGTWQNQNMLGASGLPAIGEAAFAKQITYGIPDILGNDRSTYAGKRVLVVGGGHSAANALIDLARIGQTDGSLSIIWAVRGDNLARLFGGGAADQLGARGQLGMDVERLVQGGRLQLVKRFAAERVESTPQGLMVHGRGANGAAPIGPVDRIIVATGQRPDLDMTRELRLDLDPWLESPRALGPLIDPNLHSCGTVPPHGFKELSHPEKDYFTVGIKSYGRAPTFLLATGYEQVRSIAAHLAGDHAAASEVRLVLPETGVCSADYAGTEQASACCGGPAPGNAEACCADDAAAKARGDPGCGCSPKAAPREAANGCCSQEGRIL